MKEVYEFRINSDFAHLLFEPDEGKKVGGSIRVVELTSSDPKFHKIPIVAEEVKEQYDKGFYFAWNIRREYTEDELRNASLFHLKIGTVFEPAGEVCGTIYNEAEACEVCGGSRLQIGPLMLRNGSVPQTDIARTVAGEVVVSRRLAEAYRKSSLTGMVLLPVLLNGHESQYCQVVGSTTIELSSETVAGIDPFNLSDSSEAIEFEVSNGHKVALAKEVYRCPKGHTIGLNLLSEPYVLGGAVAAMPDFLISKQKVGVKRGLLRPEPLYLVSPRFRDMILREAMTGFAFEVAHIE